MIQLYKHSQCKYCDDNCDCVIFTLGCRCDHDCSCPTVDYIQNRDNDNGGNIYDDRDDDVILDIDKLF